MKIKKYGWLPDLPDIRDLRMGVMSSATAEALPPKVDLSTTKFMPPVFDQGELGSCTANAIAAAVEFDQRRQKPVWDFMPSRLYIYFNEREMEGTIDQDSGAYIRDGIKAVNQKGVCREDLCPYLIENFRQRPSDAAYKNAILHKALVYQRVPQTEGSVKGVLANGTPIVFGFSVYDGFESAEVARSGLLNLPMPGESLIGGHAVLCCGYDDNTRRFLIRNSWGAGWGLAGYFTMPYDYLLNPNLADDLWAINTMSV